MAENPKTQVIDHPAPAIPVNGHASWLTPVLPPEANGFHAEPGLASPGDFVSAEEFLAHYSEHPDFTYEWNNGILEEKPVSTIGQFKLYRWFLQILACYLEVNHFAESAMFEFLAQMQLPNKSVKRKPDLLVVRHDNLTPLHDDDSSYSGVCDLCVELLSTSSEKEIDRDIKDKKAEYAAAGIREYVILDHTGEYMEFYRLGANGAYEAVQPDADGIVRSEVLPGFQFRWSDLYRRPPLNELVEDPIYSQFVIPNYQLLKSYAAEERQRADEAEQLVQQATQRAEAAEELLAQYAEQLRALGIEPKRL